MLRRGRRSHKVCGDAELAVDIGSSAQKPPPAQAFGAVSRTRFPPANTLLAFNGRYGRKEERFA